MGEQRVSILSDKKQMNAFIQKLLNDMEAMEYMLDNNWFENDITRIGAEQEMVLVDKNTKRAASKAMEALDLLQKHPWAETEIAQFNLETTMTPLHLNKSCFTEMEKESVYKLKTIQEKLDELDVEYVLTGILPTLKKYDLDISNLTPKKRYAALIDSINNQLIGDDYQLKLFGIDELCVKHDSPLMEACNTSFQVHLQVAQDDFVRKYNIAQAITAPIMAISANSPLVFGRRLWHESRIAMFQQSIDTRTTHDHMRVRSPRVNFGNDWIHDSVMDIYKEDIARFRVLISADMNENSLKKIAKNKVPKLRALQVHNSTVYRWNRPCYGISDNGKPHLRIECRVIPSGPSVVDEIANACFWVGMVEGMADHVKDIRKRLSFADVKDNFEKASRYGIDSSFNWFDSKKISACDLILTELLPLARKGLTKHGVSKKDINKYLGIIEQRAKKHMNGARWQLRSFTDLKSKVSVDEALTILTASIQKNQARNIPVHKWKEAKRSDFDGYDPKQLKVSDFMETDLFTVQKDDIISLVAKLMDWKNIRFTPVENTKGRLIGLVTEKDIVRLLTKSEKSKKTYTVSDIMIDNPVTISESQTITDAMKLMKKSKIGCLPVVKEGELIGIVTEEDFVGFADRLLG
jgi:CBS domain-containing protein/gamma-glutamylcysteine synthetase